MLIHSLLRSVSQKQPPRDKMPQEVKRGRFSTASSIGSSSSNSIASSTERGTFVFFVFEKKLWIVLVSPLIPLILLVPLTPFDFECDGSLIVFICPTSRGLDWERSAHEWIAITSILQHFQCTFETSHFHCRPLKTVKMIVPFIIFNKFDFSVASIQNSFRFFFHLPSM